MNKSNILLTISTSAILGFGCANNHIPNDLITPTKIVFINSDSSSEGNLTTYSSTNYKENGYSNNYKRNGIIEESIDMFGEMRDLTSYEETACNRAIDKMSEATGVRLF